MIIDFTGRVLARSAEWNSPGLIAWSADDREAWFTETQDYVSSDLRALSSNGSERTVARFDGVIVPEDIARGGQVLMKRSTVVGGIRGRSALAREERELGWYDEPYAYDVSADGRTLLFQEAGLFGGNQYAVCLRGMDGSPPIKLGAGTNASLSPDGRWAASILMTSPQRLLLLPTGSGDSTSLRRGPIENYYDTGWLPGAKHVVFVASEQGHARRTYVQDLVGGPPRPVTAEGIAGTRVSHDGRLLAAVSRDQRLFVCPLNGDSAKFAATLQPGEEVIAWASDGRSLYFGTSGTSLSVSRLDLASGHRSPWKRFSIADSAGIDVQNARLSPNGESYAFTYARNLSDLYLVDGLK